MLKYIQELLWTIAGANTKVLQRSPSDYAFFTFWGGYIFVFAILFSILSSEYFYDPKSPNVWRKMLPVVGGIFYLILNHYFLKNIKPRNIWENNFRKKIRLVGFTIVRISLSILLSFFISETILVVSYDITSEPISRNSFLMEIIIILIFVIDLLPYFIKIIKKESPYDYLLELEIKKQESEKNAQLTNLKKELELAETGNISSLETEQVTFTPKEYTMSLYISKIVLKNIRCFEDLEISLKNKKDTSKWLVLLGDNSTGKSTILRSIAIGLSDESGASSLIKLLKSPILRIGTSKGRIEITLTDQKSKENYKITTKISSDPDSSSERVRKETELSGDTRFLYDNIFLLGYGSQRAIIGEKSIQEYKVDNAVKTLFDYSESLINPEVVILREDLKIRDKIIKKVSEVLLLDVSMEHIQTSSKGLKLDEILLEAVSDGYRSTLNWILDLIGWAISANKFNSSEGLEGIILIDEIEQHLHPRWQRKVVEKLREQFPKMQFIATTHTPLLVSGASDFKDSQIVRLERDREDGHVKASPLPNDWMANKEAGKILLDAFNMTTTKSPKSSERVEDFSELLNKKKRSPEEEKKFRDLRKELSDGFDIELSKETLEKYKDLF